MSFLSTENNAINLSQGFPDFDVDRKLVEIIKATSSKKVHQYCPMSGLPELLKETASSSEKRLLKESSIQIKKFL
jgi:methionine aminotransferase